MRKIRIRPLGGAPDFFIAADEAAYTASLGQNRELDTHIVRYEYTSLTTPATVYDYDIQTGERQLMKRTPVLGDFDPANYRTELVGPARRRLVPAIITTRNCKGQHGPLLQYGYGSYSATMDPFSIARVSLLTAASCSRSRTCAAARRWAGAGTRTASCSTSATPSTTSSTSRASW
jgi:oligopeptidase B